MEFARNCWGLKYSGISFIFEHLCKPALFFLANAVDIIRLFFSYGTAAQRGPWRPHS